MSKENVSKKIPYIGLFGLEDYLNGDDKNSKKLMSFNSGIAKETVIIAEDVKPDLNKLIELKARRDSQDGLWCSLVNLLITKFGGVAITPSLQPAPTLKQAN